MYKIEHNKEFPVKGVFGSSCDKFNIKMRASRNSLFLRSDNGTSIKINVSEDGDFVVGFIKVEEVPIEFFP